MTVCHQELVVTLFCTLLYIQPMMIFKTLCTRVLKQEQIVLMQQSVSRQLGLRALSQWYRNYFQR